MNMTRKKEQLERNRKHIQLQTPKSEGLWETPDEDHLICMRMFSRAFSSLASEKKDVDTKRMEKGKERKTLNIRLSGERAKTVAARCAWGQRGDAVRGESETRQLSSPLPNSQSPKKKKRNGGKMNRIQCEYMNCRGFRFRNCHPCGKVIFSFCKYTPLANVCFLRHRSQLLVCYRKLPDHLIYQIICTETDERIMEKGNKTCLMCFFIRNVCQRSKKQCSRAS